MSSRIFEGSETRPLFIDFNAYTDGDDEFKKELVDLMIDDLRELQQTLHLAAPHNDAPLFLKVCHKIKTTIHMLDDPEFSAAVDEVKANVTDTSRNALLDRLCAGIIESLRRE